MSLKLWCKRVADCYIRVSQIVETKNVSFWFFFLKEQKAHYYVKAYLYGVLTQYFFFCQILMEYTELLSSNNYFSGVVL